MGKIKLIDKNTDIKNLTMHGYDWDLVVNGRKYQVVRIDGYVHTVNSTRGDNDLWAYPRNETPSHRNLLPFNSSLDHGVSWGISTNPLNIIKDGYDVSEISSYRNITITRNGEVFCTCASVAEAFYKIDLIKGHPLDLFQYEYEKNIIKRKIFWKDDPAVITRYVKGEAEIQLKCDGVDRFTYPAKYNDDPIYRERYDEFPDIIITDIFDTNITWFRTEEV